MRGRLGRVLGRFFVSSDPHRDKNVRFVCGLSLLSLGVWSCSQHVPAGHVALIQHRKDDFVRPYMFGSGELFCFDPLRTRVVLMRADPLKKKLLTTQTTKDNKQVEVFIQIRVAPKLAFVPEIFSHFGSNYAREFLDSEVEVDVKNVIGLFSFDELVGEPPAGEKAKEEIQDAIDTAAAFFKLVVSETKIIIRDPNAEEE